MKKYKGFNEIYRPQIEPLYIEALNDTNKPFVFPDGIEIKYSDILIHFKPNEYEEGFFNYCDAQNIMVIKSERGKLIQFFEKEED